MALITTPVIKATVAAITKEKQNEYGPYRSVLFESSQLPEGKLWRILKPAGAQQLHRGQRVDLTPTKTNKGKEGWNIRPLSAAPTSQPTAPQVQPVKPAVRSSEGRAMLSPQPQTVAQPSRREPTTQERRQQIEAYIFSMANLHTVCYQAAEQAYDGTDAPDEVIRAATSSLFISAERRFHLTSSQ